MIQRGFTGKFCLGVTNEFALGMSAEAAAIWRLPGQEDPILWWLIHMDSQAVPVVGPRPHLLSIGCSDILMARYISPQREQCQRARWGYHVFYSPASDVTSTVFRWSQATSDGLWCACVGVGRRTLKGWGYQQTRITGGHLQNLATTVYWAG